MIFVKVYLEKWLKNVSYVKFIYSEKAAKFCEISTLLLSVITVDKGNIAKFCDILRIYKLFNTEDFWKRRLTLKTQNSGIWSICLDKIQQFTWSTFIFFDKIKQILYPQVRNSMTQLTLACRDWIYKYLDFLDT